VMNVICVADSKFSACAVDASRSCRSRRYPLTPQTMVTTLSAPGPLVQHSTALRVATLLLCGFLNRLADANPPRRGGPLCPPAQDGYVVMNVICVADSKFSACAVDASHSCRSCRYPLTPLTMVTTLSAPGPLVQHSTALRVGRYASDVSGPIFGYKMSV